MKSIKLVLLLAITVALAALVLQNQMPWEVRFFWLTGEVPAIVILLLTVAAGFSVGIISALLMKRSSIKNTEKKNI